MWVFGYGSLMWDDWERQFDGTRYEKAQLHNYRRSFNKKSVLNWGTKEKPGPTLGLEPKGGARCIGSAFEFLDSQQQAVLDYLRTREGRSFNLKCLDVDLEDGRCVQAITPVNDSSARTYIGNLCLEKRVAMAAIATGTNGKCIDYVRNIRSKLSELGISDPYVEEFWEATCTAPTLEESIVKETVTS